jgi:hypothetical protein
MPIHTIAMDDFVQNILAVLSKTFLRGLPSRIFHFQKKYHSEAPINPRRDAGERAAFAHLLTDSYLTHVFTMRLVAQ